MALRWIKETAKAQGLHARDRAVLRELADMANSAGELWPRQDTLAAKMGRSERTVRTALKNLEDTGWIERTHRQKSNGARTSDVIRIRTVAEGAAWVQAKMEAEEAAEREALARAEAHALKLVSTSTSEHVDAVLPPPVGEIQLDLARRLQAQGQEPPAEWSEGSSVRRPVKG